MDPRRSINSLYVKRGDPITAAGWNTLVDAVAPDPVSKYVRRRYYRVHNVTGVTIPRYSAFTFDDSSFDVATNRAFLELTYGSTITPGGQAVILTNETSTMLNGQWGTAYIVDTWAPACLIASEAIAVGAICGPPNNSFKIDNAHSGLIAITSCAADGDTVWCISQSGGESGSGSPIPAKVTTQITARGGYGGLTAGSGEADLYRLNGTSLEVSSSTITILSVYSTAVAVGTWITVSRDEFGDYWIIGADCQ